MECDLRREPVGKLLFMRKGTIAVWATLLIVGPSIEVGAARAQDAPAAEDVRTAADRFDAGRVAFKAGNFAEAAEYFEAADAKAPSGPALMLAMRSRFEAGQIARAATLAVLAKQSYPNDTEIAQLAQTVLERADTEAGRADVSCAPACDLLLDGKIVHGHAAANRVVYADAGSHSLRASWGEKGNLTKEFQVEAGGQIELEFEAEREPDPEPAETESLYDDESGAPAPLLDEPPDQTPSKGWSPTVFWVGVGLTAVAGIATTYSGIDTLKNPGEDAIRRECVNQGTDCPLYQDAKDKELRTNILAGVTAAFAVGTLIVGTLATDWNSGSKSAPASALTLPGRVSVTPIVGFAPSVGRGSSASPSRGMAWEAIVGTTGRF